mmetsp:Transcript_110082/g.290480  ORF Transcript_110082/g.290480 Transcript_110082/m.290480 type:complete len:82 (-) Transcript_110082:245-490(-)
MPPRMKKHCHRDGDSCMWEAEKQGWEEAQKTEERRMGRASRGAQGNIDGRGLRRHSKRRDCTIIMLTHSGGAYQLVCKTLE